MVVLIIGESVRLDYLSFYGYFCDMIFSFCCMLKDLLVFCDVGLMVYYIYVVVCNFVGMLGLQGIVLIVQIFLEVGFRMVWLFNQECSEFSEYVDVFDYLENDYDFYLCCDFVLLLLFEFFFKQGGL